MMSRKSKVLLDSDSQVKSIVDSTILSLLTKLGNTVSCVMSKLIIEYIDKIVLILKSIGKY